MPPTSCAAADRDQDPPAGRAHDRGRRRRAGPGPRRGRRRPSAPDAGPVVAAGAGGRQPVVRRRRAVQRRGRRPVAMHDAGHGDERMFEARLADGLSEAPLEVPSVLAIAALRNLLDNALRHRRRHPGGLAVETEQGCARFHVRDHGPASPKPTCRISPGASGATARAAAAGSVWPSSRPSCNAANAGWTSTAARTACGDAGNAAARVMRGPARQPAP